MKNTLISTQSVKERAFLVGVELEEHQAILSIEDSLEELALLAKTAGLKVIGHETQRLVTPNPATYIGSGKVQEIKAIAESLHADVILFDDELSPRNFRELENVFGSHVRVIDRTTLILDIFAQHAQSHEGKLQVELAQYEYLLPRLTRAWTHLARQAGGGAGRTGSVGGVGLRGPGETQLEVDRRRVRERISRLKNDLEKVRQHRQRYRANRKRSFIPVVTLVGYTNAGKSTLLNNLTHADVLVANQLFATLDPTTRRLELPGGNAILMTDTVGFIQKLPTNLVAAFRATLEEITESDLLLHIVDATHPNALQQWRSVLDTLHEIDAEHIPMITVLNKVDRLPIGSPDPATLPEFSGAVKISAAKSTGINELVAVIKNELFERFTPISVTIPYSNGQLISLFHEFGKIDKIINNVGSVTISGSIPGRLMADFERFTQKQKSRAAT
ncbi:MAG: GTPase HflX [Anaerolineae bacterium]|nr:GTPase HflX [Anaerolineae bacterium]